MMTMEQRKRSDYRSMPWGGPFGAYLLNGYLAKQDWCPDGPVKVFEQPYETARNASGFVHLEGGKPAMKRAYLNHLSGYPWQAVRAAIEMVRDADPEAIAVLEYYQLPESRRPSRYVFAMDSHISEQTISERWKRAVRKVHDHLWLARDEWDGREVRG